MAHYYIEPKTRKYTKGYGFLSFAKNPSHKYKKKLLNTATKIGLDALNTFYKKLLQKTAEEFTGKKTADKTIKPKPKCLS